MAPKHLVYPLAGLLAVAAVFFGHLQGRSEPPAVKTAEPAMADAAVAYPKVDIYDADPDHLWNRLHSALFVRATTSRGGNEESVPETNPEIHAYELDPMFWHQSRWLLIGPGHKPAVAVLDEFLANNGEKLIKEPLKRALLQRDLWALLDSALLNPDWFTYTEYSGRKQDPYKPERREMAERVVRIIRRLALTREQIETLPDNYAAAVAAKTFPTKLDTGKADTVFLPPDLWDGRGSWVVLGDKSNRPLAQTHVDFFGGRSNFFVFLRLPEGRDATCEFLGQLRVWVRDGRKGDPPALPYASAVALARQMVLIDDKGEMRSSPVTESVQIRAFRGTDRATTTNPKDSTENSFEIKLRRQDLLAGKAGGLYALKPEETERAFLTFIGHNAGEGNEAVLPSCFGCHNGGSALESINSFSRRFDRFRSKPELTPSTRQDEAHNVWSWKRHQITWGLVNWLKED